MCAAVSSASPGAWAAWSARTCWRTCWWHRLVAPPGAEHLGVGVPAARAARQRPTRPDRHRQPALLARDVDRAHADRTERQVAAPARIRRGRANGGTPRSVRHRRGPRGAVASSPRILRTSTCCSPDPASPARRAPPTRSAERHYTERSRARCRHRDDDSPGTARRPGHAGVDGLLRHARHVRLDPQEQPLGCRRRCPRAPSSRRTSVCSSAGRATGPGRHRPERSLGDEARPGQVYTCMVNRGPVHLAKVATTVDLISGRGAMLSPLPLVDGPPLRIADGGKARTLRIAAEHTARTSFDNTPNRFTHESRVLADHCAAIGRPFEKITRSASFIVVIGATVAEHHSRTVPTRAATVAEDLRHDPGRRPGADRPDPRPTAGPGHDARLLLLHRGRPRPLRYRTARARGESRRRPEAGRNPSGRARCRRANRPELIFHTDLAACSAPRAGAEFWAVLRADAEFWAVVGPACGMSPPTTDQNSTPSGSPEQGRGAIGGPGSLGVETRRAGLARASMGVIVLG